jgi:hypothetical protein
MPWQVVTRAAAALLLAGVLWLIVGGEETTATWVPVRVALTIDSAVTVSEAVAPVRAFVVGSRRDLFRLRQSPPVLHRAITDDAPDSVRIEVREQDLDMPPGTQARVTDLSPRLLTIHMRRIAK